MVSNGYGAIFMIEVGLRGVKAQVDGLDSPENGSLYWRVYRASQGPALQAPPAGDT